MRYGSVFGEKMDQVYLEIHAVVSLNVDLRGVGLVANDVESLPEGWTWCSCQHGVSPSFDGGHKHVVEGSQLIYSCRYSPYLLNKLNNSCSSEESIQRIWLRTMPSADHSLRSFFPLKLQQRHALESTELNDYRLHHHFGKVHFPGFIVSTIWMIRQRDSWHIN